MRILVAIGTLAWLATMTAPAFAQEGEAGWVTYVSTAGGYAIDMPADWTVDEQPDQAGQMIALLMDGSGTRQLMIAAAPFDPASADFDDLPNVRCQQVMIGELAARRCLDTIARTLITTASSTDRTYTFVTERRLSAEVEPMLASFRLLPPASE